MSNDDDDSALPGRVYNSIHRVPLEWFIGSYRLGMLSALFLLIAAGVAVVSIRSLPWYGALVPTLIALIVAFLGIKAINDADPDHALTEWTALRSITRGARSRYSDNYRRNRKD